MLTDQGASVHIFLAPYMSVKHHGAGKRRKPLPHIRWKIGRGSSQNGLAFSCLPFILFRVSSLWGRLPIDRVDLLPYLMCSENALTDTLGIVNPIKWLYEIGLRR